MTLDDVGNRGTLASGLRWVAAGTLVLALHAGVIAGLVRAPDTASTATGGAEMVEVDLEPVEGEKAPDEMPPEMSGDPATTAAAATDSAATTDNPMTPPAPVPPQPPAPASPPEPPKAEPVPPPLPEPPKVEAVQPPPPPEVPPVPPPRQTPPPSRAAAASTASAAADETAPPVQKLSAGREAAWRGKLVAHLNRFRRFPPGLGSGTTRVGFTIDVEGRVTATSIVGGSGNPALDAAARALVERASPFPTPPAGVSGKGLSFVVPVHFDDWRP